MKKEITDIQDQLLVMDAQDGSVEAMEKLVKRWQKRLWGYAFHLTADQHAAWDITQQSWLGIIKGIRKLHDPANFKSWAYKVTTNKVINWIKKNKRIKILSLDDIQDKPQQTREDTAVKELLKKLDIKKQTVINLYYFEQLNISEISNVLKVPQGTVKSRLAVARRELKELYHKYYE